jgi:hypothetical protein
MLALVLLSGFSHVQNQWLPHSRRAQLSARSSMMGYSVFTPRSPGGGESGSPHVRVRLSIGRGSEVDGQEGDKEGLDAYGFSEDEEELLDSALGVNGTKKKLTKREKNIIMNARRQNNLLAHLNGSYTPPPPVFDFKSTGNPGGLGAPPDGDIPIYLLDKVNLHLHQEQFDRDGYRGGIRPNRERSGAVISASLNYPMIGQEGATADVKYNFNPADVSFLQPKQYNLSYRTCAVVGNSATLLRHKYGAEIDAHDMVLRINYAPVEGYQSHVGSVTTFDMVNSKHAAKMSSQVVDLFHQGLPMLDATRNRTAMVLFEAANWHRNYYTYSRLLQKLPAPHLLILSPDFANAVEVLWRRVTGKWPDLANGCDRRVRSTELGLRKGKGCREFGVACGYSTHRGMPSSSCKAPSGFVSTVFAAQMCNSITMYGFEAVTTDHANDTSHYFDDEPANLAAHSYVLTDKVLRYFGSLYPIEIRDR